MSFNYYAFLAALLRFSFLILLRCHFHLICLFFFQRLELRFILINYFFVYLINVLFLKMLWPGFEPGSQHRKCRILDRTRLPEQSI